MSSVTESNLGLNYGWAYGESGWNTGMDDNLVKLGFTSRNQLKGILSAPPSTPSNGDAYIVGTSPTGLFSGNFGKVAIWDRTVWLFLTPKNHEIVYNVADGCDYKYDNGWVLKQEDELSPYVKVKDFTFSTGYTITDQKQCLLNLADNKYYQWFGDLPKVVAAGSTPATSGGIGAGAWSDKTDLTLRSELLNGDGSNVGVKMPSSSYQETLAEYLANGVFNIADYGASPSKTGAENHLIMSAVEVLAKAVGGRVLVPQGVFLRAGNTVMDGRFALCGVHNAVQNHGDVLGSIIKYEGNYGTKVTMSSKVLIEDIAFTQVDGTDASGIDLQAAGRSTLSRVTVDGFAGNGINAVNGNLSSYTDIICLSNGGDGFKMVGLATPDINCASLRNIDSRGNGGIGINLDSAWNVMGFGLVAQSNTGYGVVVNNCRQSFLVIYSENNAGGSIHYTSHTNNEGNFIIESFVDVTSLDESKGENTILKGKTGADTWSMFEKMVCKSLVIPNIAATGGLRLKHDTAARHDFYAEKTGQKQTLRWKNVAGLTTEDSDAPIYPFVHHFYGAVVQRERLIFPDGSSAPTVDMSESWLANNSTPTTINNFTGGQNNQVIYVVFNNANTTIVHSATTTGIRLKGAANKTFGQYEGATFIKNGLGWWIEV